MSRKESRPIVYEAQMDNGLVVTIADLSKRLVADRWLVKLVCEASLPITAELWDRHRPEDLELLAEIRKVMGESLCLRVLKEKNFIAEAEKEMITQDMISRLREHIFAYLDDPAFPEKLFLRRYTEAREQCRLAAQRRVEAASGEEQDEEEGPADFSHCFR